MPSKNGFRANQSRVLLQVSPADCLTTLGQIAALVIVQAEFLACRFKLLLQDPVLLQQILLRLSLSLGSDHLLLFSIHLSRRSFSEDGSNQPIRPIPRRSRHSKTILSFASSRRFFRISVSHWQAEQILSLKGIWGGLFSSFRSQVSSLLQTRA